MLARTAVRRASESDRIRPYYRISHRRPAISASAFGALSPTLPSGLALLSRANARRVAARGFAASRARSPACDGVHRLLGIPRLSGVEPGDAAAFVVGRAPSAAARPTGSDAELAAPSSQSDHTTPSSQSDRATSPAPRLPAPERAASRAAPIELLRGSRQIAPRVHKFFMARRNSQW